MARSLIVHSLTHNPWHNLALEEYLMRKMAGSTDPRTGRSTATADGPIVQAGHPVTQQNSANTSEYSSILYLWQNQDTVVIGRNQNAWSECQTALLEAEGGRLARRSTGGGAVFHDLGNLNFSLLLPQDRFDLDRNFNMVLNAVRLHGIDAERSGRNDILVDGLKFSGNAFRVNYGVGLHHGTLLVHSDYGRVARYLTVSPAKLAAKGIQSVRSRITNLSTIKPDLTIDQLKQSMEQSFISSFCPEHEMVRLTDADFPPDHELTSLREQFSSWKWRYGESIHFDASVETRFPWGLVQLGFNIRNGLIERTTLYTDALDCDFLENLATRLQGIRFHSDSMARVISSTDRHHFDFGISRQVMADDLAGLIVQQGW